MTLMRLANMHVRRLNRWNFARFELLGAVILCALVPLVLRLAGLARGQGDPQAVNTFIGVVTAIVIGTWLHHRIRALPGFRDLSGLIPSYALSFGAVALIILTLRIDYTRSLLIAGFLLALVWFHAVALFNQSHERVLLGIIEGGDAGELAKVANAIAVPLSLEDWPDKLNAVAADFRFDHSDAWERRMADYALAGIPVYHSKDLHESLTGRANLEQLSENNLGSLGPLLAVQQFKAIVDRLTALPALIVFLPLFALVAIAIKLDSPGPVFFRQSRVGRGGKEFRVVKFRTMTVTHTDHATSSRDDFITQDGDQRVTRLGRLLRRSRIDELPQVINILLGEMSWIGPRPEAAALSQWYEQEIPFYRYRHVVMPGITGWAQVNQGHVADLDSIRTKLQYDFFYIRNFSIWLDIAIIAKTVKTVLNGFGHK